MRYDSLDFAAHIARLCNKFGYTYNNTKIQKLLYCCYGCVLAKFGERIVDEYPRAWQYGPVFPRVFNFIHKKKNLLDREEIDTLSPEVGAFVEEVVKMFGKYKAVSLSDWTHKDGSPWDAVVNKMGCGLQGVIPDEIIEDYFKANIVRS